MVDLTQTDLELDELEALRLADSVGLSQAEAGNAMGISQPTFNRVLSSARKKVADSLVFGRAIRICQEAHDGSRQKIEHNRPENCGCAKHNGKRDRQ
jgi:predicted DNA-binding protein (UPF0251 family)